MLPKQVRLLAAPALESARMVIAFSGWMDGGEASTGTVEHLVEALGAEELAELESDEFYLWSFPGSMEVASLFRPHVRVEQGLIDELDLPTGRFYYDMAHHLILFAGREPNLRWPLFADCLLSLGQRFGVKALYFVGSVGGAVPHTREPRLFASVSDATFKSELEKTGLRFIDYEGPASIATYLCRLAPERGMRMANLVAEVPAYIQGRNVRSIESMVRKLGQVLGLSLDLEEMRTASDELEHRLSEAVKERPELRELIEKLESDYDNDVFNTQMGDFKQWLEAKGLRLD
ncbi:MAG: PAC2 family protein [Phycisphaeraceae bacterium]|nr:PAC2 family protein [Phycisphaeraceae bacterium]